MSKLLGTAYEVGKSDVVISRRPTGGTKHQEGLFMKLASAEGYFNQAGSGDIPIGVLGAQESVAASIIISGMRVAVQLEAGLTPVAGEVVYVKASNHKATNLSEGGSNPATAAVFTGVTGTDGVTTNTSSKHYDRLWAEINMPNGL